MVMPQHTIFENSRSVLVRYSLRINDDDWLFQTVTSLNFARSQSIFSYAKIWIMEFVANISARK